MIIGGKKYSEITVKDGERRTIASITDDRIIMNGDLDVILHEDNTVCLCDTCIHNPPSVSDDKPCYFCDTDDKLAIYYEPVDDYYKEDAR